MVRFGSVSIRLGSLSFNNWIFSKDPPLGTAPNPSRQPCSPILSCHSLRRGCHHCSLFAPPPPAFARGVATHCFPYHYTWRRRPLPPVAAHGVAARPATTHESVDATHGAATCPAMAGELAEAACHFLQLATCPFAIYSYRPTATNYRRCSRSTPPSRCSQRGRSMPMLLALCSSLLVQSLVPSSHLSQINALCHPPLEHLEDLAQRKAAIKA